MRAAAPPIALVLHLGLLLLARQHTGVDAAVESPGQPVHEQLRRHLFCYQLRHLLEKL
jgi:hypothetical protein